MFRITCGSYNITLADTLPTSIEEYRQHTELFETVECERFERSLCFITVAQGNSQPLLALELYYEPGPESGFYPGVALIEKTQRLFIGAGRHIFVYSLQSPRRLYELPLFVGGFWRWEYVSEYVIMSTELELGVWHFSGELLWTTRVEPPWEYEVQGANIYIDVMGKQMAFALRSGKPVVEGTEKEWD